MPSSLSPFVSKGVLFTICILAAGAARAKDCRTYYTDARIAVGRENVTKYDWVKKLRKRILETGDQIRYYIGPEYTAADAFVKQSDDFIWLLQPTTEIPRTYDMSFRTICPVCGQKVRKISPWNCWRIDPITHPYQVQCRLCGRWFPSNRYDKGDLTSGPYPDDGDGWEHDGKRYYFLREYAHMCYGSIVIPTLRSLSQAYLLTGDKRYAHKCCVLIARLATQYPNYGWEGADYKELENRFDRTYVGPWGGHHPHYKWKTGGMITDLIWETFCLEATAYAYDAVYDAMADDPELIAFVQKKGMPVENADDLRTYIENYIFRAGMVGLLKRMIRGNEGFHQAAALAVALVMDDYSDKHPNSKDLVDFTYHGAGRTAYMMVNGLDRDGGGHESPNYNAIKCDFIQVARLMEEIRKRRPDLFPLERYPDIFAHPKAKALFDYYIDVLVQDAYLPPVGDCGGMNKPDPWALTHRRYSFLTTQNVFAFVRYGDPRFARAATTYRGRRYGGELWEPYPAQEIAAALKKPASRIERRTRLLDGYGLAILESGPWPKKRSVVLNYASLIGHRQNDHLCLWLYWRGLRLLRDLGYPRTWEYRWQWDSNSLAHNTVTVDETQPFWRSFGNAATLFASEAGVHVAAARHNPYPEHMRLGRPGAHPVDQYERMTVLVDVDDDRFYVVDCFAVDGGEQHDQSWHAMLAPVEPPKLDWRAQSTGTLAGPNVKQFAPYVDRWGRKHPKGDFPCFLTDIRRAALDRPAAWAWRTGLPTGENLRLHVVPVGGACEVIMGRGRSPAWPKDMNLDYLLVRRHVKNGASSRFLTVLDAFRGEPTVRSVRLLREKPLTLEITRGDGVDEVTIHIPDSPSRTTAPRPLGARVLVRKGGKVVRDVRIGDPGDGEGSGYARGKIAALDYERKEIVVDAPHARLDDLAPGRAIRIYNAWRSSMFRVTAAKEETPGRFRLTLDKTALAAQLPVTGVERGRLTLSTRPPFATGHVKKNGDLIDGANNYYYGCRAGEGSTARPVLSISNSRPPRLFFIGEQAPAGLQRDYVGRVIRVWLYGVGDEIEAARVVGEGVMKK